MSLGDWDFTHIMLLFRFQTDQSWVPQGRAPRVQETALSSSDGGDQALEKRLKEGTSQLGPVDCCGMSPQRQAKSLATRPSTPRCFLACVWEGRE